MNLCIKSWSIIFECCSLRKIMYCVWYINGHKQFLKIKAMSRWLVFNMNYYTVIYQRHYYCSFFCHLRCYLWFDTANNSWNLVSYLENNGRQVASIKLWPRTFRLMSLLVTYSHGGSPIVLVNWFFDFCLIAALMEQTKPPTTTYTLRSPSIIKLSWIDENFSTVFHKNLAFFRPPTYEIGDTLFGVNKINVSLFIYNLVYFSSVQPLCD